MEGEDRPCRRKIGIAGAELKGRVPHAMKQKSESAVIGQEGEGGALARPGDGEKVISRQS